MESNSGGREDSENSAERKRPKLWGTTYLILGLASIAFSAITLVHNFGIVPLYGTVSAAVLISVLGTFLIIYGFRILRKDY